LNKKNSFTDFAACAQYLVDRKYTRPDRLFARGSSGGGLLMAGVINIAPELFKGVIINVPYVDIITTNTEGRMEHRYYDELGNPADKEYYDYMLSYDPYENVGPKQYPNILIKTGFYDTRVPYSHAAKLAAKLRAMKRDENLLMLKTYMTGGHGLAHFSGRQERYRGKALEHAFLLDLAGITQ
jgi:oligopeptidase B